MNSEEIVRWLESPSGVTWSRERHKWLNSGLVCIKESVYLPDARDLLLYGRETEVYLW